MKRQHYVLITLLLLLLLGGGFWFLNSRLSVNPVEPVASSRSNQAAADSPGTFDAGNSPNRLSGNGLKPNGTDATNSVPVEGSPDNGHPAELPGTDAEDTDNTKATEPKPATEPDSEDPRGRDPDRVYGGIRGRRAPGIPASLAVSPDGELAATGSGGRLLLWAPDSEEPVRSTTSSGMFPPLSFSPDGELLACFHGRAPAVRRVDNLELIWETSLRKSFCSDMCFDAKSERLFALWQDGVLVVHDCADGKEIRRIEGIEGDPRKLQWLAEANRLCVVRRNKPALLYDLELDGEPAELTTAAEQWQIGINEPARSYVHEAGSAIVRRSFPEGAELKRADLGTGVAPGSPAYLTDDVLVVQARSGANDSILLLEANTLATLQSIQLASLSALRTNGNGRVVTIDDSGVVDFWRLENGKLATDRPFDSEPVVWATWADGGRTTIAALASGKVSFRTAYTGDEYDSIDLGDTPLMRLLLSPVGDRLVAFKADLTAWLVLLDTREIVQLGVKTQPHKAQFSIDGKTLWLAADGKVKAFETITGAESGELLPTWDQTGFRVSPDGARLAIADDASIRLIELPVESDQTLLEVSIKYLNSLDQIRWSADGQMLAVSTSFSTTLIDVAANKDLLQISRGGAVALQVQGGEMATFRLGGVVERWTTEGKLIEALESGESPSNLIEAVALEYSPDGRQLLFVGHDKSIKIWDLKD